jgi:hypothetical protein
MHELFVTHNSSYINCSGSLSWVGEFSIVFQKQSARLDVVVIGCPMESCETNSRNYEIDLGSFFN